MGAFNKETLQLPDMFVSEKIEQIQAANEPGFVPTSKKVNRNTSPNSQRDIVRICYILKELYELYSDEAIWKKIDELYGHINLYHNSLFKIKARLEAIEEKLGIKPEEDEPTY